MNKNLLWLLAEAVAVVATAGGQGTITIEALFSSWESFDSRKVRVTRAWVAQDEHETEGEDLVWTGRLSDWQGAVREAALRPWAPADDWTPGPYERGVENA